MIYLLGNRQLYDLPSDRFGVLLTFPRVCVPATNHVWAADNGCFKNPSLQADDFLRYLEKLLPGREHCLFAVAPDVVGDAVETLRRSMPVLPQIREIGLPAALVAQDGIESLLTRLDWHSFDALFLGGSTGWKLSDSAVHVARVAASRGKWIHMGRVNSYRRLRFARMIGCHSVDGTYTSFAPDLNGPRLNRWMARVGHPLLPMFNHVPKED